SNSRQARIRVRGTLRESSSAETAPPRPLPASAFARRLASADKSAGRGREEASKQKGPPSPEALSLLNRVLGGLDRPCAHDLARRLGLEHHLFAGEGVGALPSLGRGLLDHDELGEAGDEEHPVLLQLLVADVDER